MLKKIIASCPRFFLQLCLMSLYVTFPIHPSMAASNVEGIRVYQKNARLSPEHKQKLAEAIDDYRNADNIWDVLRDEFTLSHDESSPLVQDKIAWYMRNRKFLERSANRAAPYLYYILQQVKKRHLPAEVVLLPIIESGYNPFSISNVGAAGIWQLMPGTASGYGVKHNAWYDGRRDVIASTRGALNYLVYLQTFFDGNWLYAIAAYNTGEGNVLNAIRRNVRNGQNTSFWELPLAQETRSYIPSLLALAIIISHPEKYPINFPSVPNAPYLAQVEVGNPLNLKDAALLAGLSYSKLMALNSGLKSSTMTAKGPYKLVFPIENVAQFTENLARSRLNSKSLWAHYQVKSGDTLYGIAKKFVVTADALKKMNHLNNSLLRPGTNLLIPTINLASRSDASASDTPVKQLTAITTRHLSPNTSKTLMTPYSVQPGDTIYIARTKDSIASIAKRFHVSPETLKTTNGLADNFLAVGKQLIIPTHAATAQQTLEPGDTLYMIRQGDTLERIAIRFKTSPAAIRLANLMTDERLTEGEKLVVPTHMRG
ncbi:MAG: hypothetical protein A3E85_05175 [Gammaproteobacteria bacterium RIFCSPHIGHO2_12_FULL_45_12]|nr:MAG: hypothetical protein A3E85_05175 [Gammaproteobacteria bacterium RIFCSPHIGHO2_12_FULL_45_12]